MDYIYKVIVPRIKDFSLQGKDRYHRFLGNVIRLVHDEVRGSSDGRYYVHITSKKQRWYWIRLDLIRLYLDSRKFSRSGLINYGVELFVEYFEDLLIKHGHKITSIKGLINSILEKDIDESFINAIDKEEKKVDEEFEKMLLNYDFWNGILYELLEKYNTKGKLAEEDTIKIKTLKKLVNFLLSNIENKIL